MKLRHWVVLLMIPLLMVAQVYALNFNEKWLWLFYNTQRLDDLKLSWIYNVWGVVISVHGTMAALTITFMGMIVDSVVKNSPQELGWFSRIEVIENFKVLDFSCDAIFTLVVSIFLYMTGGGFVDYIISQVLTLYFFCAYFNSYLNVYLLAKNKNFTLDYIHKKSHDICISFVKNEDNVLNVKKSISKILDDGNYVSISNGNYFSSSTETKSEYITVFNRDNIMGFSQRNLNSLIKFVSEINKRYPSSQLEVILPNIQVGYSNEECCINIRCNSSYTDLVSLQKIKKISSKIFIKSDNNNPNEVYISLVDGICVYLLKSLVSGEKEKIVKAITLLASLLKDGLGNYPLDCLINRAYDYIMGEGVSAKSFTVLMSKIYQLSRSSDDKGAAFKSIMDLSMIGMSRGELKDFLKMNEIRLNEIVSYSDSRDQHCEVLLNFVLNACNTLNYEVLKFLGNFFGVETQHMSIKFFSLKKDKGLISKILMMQRYVLTTMIMRFSTLLQDEKSKNERDDICAIISNWISLAFISNDYYNFDLYTELFSVYQKDCHNLFDEQSIRGLNKSDAYGVTEPDYKIRAFVLIALFGEIDFSINKISLKYFSSIVDSLFVSEFRKHDYDKMKSIVDNDVIFEILNNEFKGKDKIESAKAKVLSYINKLESIKLEEVRLEIVREEIKHDLVREFERDVNKVFTNWIKTYFLADFINLKIHGKLVVLSGYVEKRQFIKPVDGVMYITDGGNWGRKISSLYVFNISKVLEKKFYEFDKIKKIDEKFKDGSFVFLLNKSGEVNLPIEFYSCALRLLQCRNTNLPDGVFILPLANFSLSRLTDNEFPIYLEVKDILEQDAKSLDTREGNVISKLNIYPCFNLEYISQEVAYFIDCDSIIKQCDENKSG